MPDENEELAQAESEQNEEQESQNSGKISLLKVGVPMLLVQVVLAYFIASNFIVPRLYGDANSAEAGNSQSGEIAEREDVHFGKIYKVEDVIVNPADSKGMQFVLINFGIEVKDGSDVSLLEKREIQVRDILIKVLSSKTLAELDGPQDKEVLRKEVKNNLKGILPPDHLMNVYFSNYIIQ